MCIRGLNGIPFGKWLSFFRARYFRTSSSPWLYIYNCVNAGRRDPLGSPRASYISVHASMITGQPSASAEAQMG